MSNWPPIIKQLLITLPFLTPLLYIDKIAAESSCINNDQPAWQQTLEKAKGQTVYFTAWGGDERINSYINWAAKELDKQHGIILKLIKIDDISLVVSRILYEKKAGRTQKGTVDLIWINGENFRSMKQNNLLYGPFSSQLPAMRFIDPIENPTTTMDFGEPVDCMEAPWGMAQLVFIYDSQRITKPPTSAEQLLSFAEKNPGKVTYPSPPDFIGITLIKQLLSELINNTKALQNPVPTNKQTFDILTLPLWDYLDKLHSFLWRKGTSFPINNLALTPLLDDGEILLSMTFNPAYASSAIASGALADTVRTYIHDKGTLGNTHFLAIPFNSSSTEGARVVIDFLLSPKAQVMKANPNVWGDPTVLSMAKLSNEERQHFQKLPLGVATLSSKQRGMPLPEPHYSWVPALEKAWQQRYR